MRLKEEKGKETRTNFKGSEIREGNERPRTSTGNDWESDRTEGKTRELRDGQKDEKDVKEGQG